jgi:hypothetical protein
VRHGREIGEKRELAVGQPQWSAVDGDSTTGQIDHHADRPGRHDRPVRAGTGNQFGDVRREIVGKARGKGSGGATTGYVDGDDDSNGGAGLLGGLRYGLVHDVDCAPSGATGKGFASS